MSDNSPVALRLKEIRSSKGLTQQGLGMLLGMDENTASASINQYEQGKHMPSYPTLKRLANELGVPVSYFFCEDKGMAEAVVLLDKLTVNQRQAILQVIREMAGQS